MAAAQKQLAVPQQPFAFTGPEEQWIAGDVNARKIAADAQGRLYAVTGSLAGNAC